MGVHKKRIVLKHLSANRHNRTVLVSPNLPKRKLEFAVRKLLRDKSLLYKRTPSESKVLGCTEHKIIIIKSCFADVQVFQSAEVILKCLYKEKNHSEPL